METEFPVCDLELSELERDILKTIRHQLAFYKVHSIEGGFYYYKTMQPANKGRKDISNLKAYFDKMLSPYHTLPVWQIAHGIYRGTPHQDRDDQIQWLNWILDGTPYKG